MNMKYSTIDTIFKYILYTLLNILNMIFIVHVHILNVHILTEVTKKFKKLEIITDVTNKIFPKSSRKRESAGTSSFSKSEQSRKYNNVQKTKNFDKRPKPKGQYYGSSKENTKVHFHIIQLH